MSHCYSWPEQTHKVIISVGEHVDRDLLKHSESLQAESDLCSNLCLFTS